MPVLFIFHWTLWDWNASGPFSLYPTRDGPTCMRWFQLRPVTNPQMMCMNKFSIIHSRLTWLCYKFTWIMTAHFPPMAVLAELSNSMFIPMAWIRWIPTAKVFMNMQKAERVGYVSEIDSKIARRFNTSNSLKSHHHSTLFLFVV